MAVLLAHACCVDVPFEAADDDRTVVVGVVLVAGSFSKINHKNVSERKVVKSIKKAKFSKLQQVFERSKRPN